MEKMRVRDLMVPVEQFPKISDRSTFYEALTALEKAQEDYLAGRAEQRILLVQNESGKIVSKISPIDLVRGLETNYNRVNTEDTIRRFGLAYIWESLRKDYQLWEDPFKDLCRKAGEVHVRDFIKPPPDGQIVSPDDAMIKCFHYFVMDRHDSLFVAQKDEIVGLLRFSDVYRAISKSMKECAV
jgi:Mg2+/Co2+ transporter CorC